MFNDEISKNSCSLDNHIIIIRELEEKIKKLKQQISILKCKDKDHPGYLYGIPLVIDDNIETFVVK